MQSKNDSGGDVDKLGADQQVEMNLADETNKPSSPPQSVYWMNHLKRRRHPKKIQNEDKGHQTLRTSTPRAEAHQMKLQICLNHMRSMHPIEMKAQVSDGLSFEILKFESQVKNNDKGVELEEKKFNHSVALEEKKWDHGMNLEKTKLDWEKEEKDKDQSFEMA
ncbi:hypothetical protein VP01_7085g1, partial [Puccinia sorghi]